MAQESGGLVQYLDGFTDVFFPAQHGDIDPGMRQVARNLDTGDTDHAQPGILEFLLQDSGHLALDLFTDAARPRKFSGHG